MKFAPIARGAYRWLTDARYRHLYWQRRIEDIPTRDRWAERLATDLPPVPDVPSPDLAPLLADGVVQLGPLLSPDEVAEMRAYFDRHSTYDPVRPGRGEFAAPHEAPPEAHSAHYADPVVVNAPHALRLANDPRVLAAVTAYFGAKPTISYMAAWWSLVHGHAAKDAELFHRDYDDFRFLKLFVYLTDVGPDGGPHQFVRGSHRDRRLITRRRFSDAEVAQAYPAEDRLEMTGPAGTSFLESTFGLHRGLPSRAEPRLMIQALYCLKPDTNGPRRPVCDVPAQQGDVTLDAYINRIYVNVR